MRVHSQRKSCSLLVRLVDPPMKRTIHWSAELWSVKSVWLKAWDPQGTLIYIGQWLILVQNPPSCLKVCTLGIILLFCFLKCFLSPASCCLSWDPLLDFLPQSHNSCSSLSPLSGLSAPNSFLFPQPQASVFCPALLYPSLPPFILPHYPFWSYNPCCPLLHFVTITLPPEETSSFPPFSPLP